ncbi:trypsin-like peptidase domain-containing protein [Candidatus Micrarchaeota archaeon]|nr:trypsin-like peptidase domain-containing protein [Candidatus Micrarchaeota archaeon]
MDRTLLLGLGVVTVIIIMVIASGFGILAYFGAFQTTSTIDVQIKTSGNGCEGYFTYSIELKNDNKRGIANQEISTYINGKPFETLITDQNGRLSSTKDIPKELCGKETNITFAFGGNVFYKDSANATKIIFKTPTKLEISSPNQTTNNSITKINVRLKNSLNGSGIPNQKINIIGDATGEATTDNQGNVVFNVQLNQVGNKKIKASFFGDRYLLSSESDTAEINVMPETCADGTNIGQCSRQVSYFCNQDRQLVFDCSSCGCGSGLVCSSNNTCLTQEKATTELITELQKGIVKVQHSLASGSGVIIAHSNAQTIILTNEHVVEQANSIGDVKVVTNDQKTVNAADIRIAPNDMDLAVIYLNGIYGTPVQINYSENYPQGTNVLALGSPLGLQGSVSNGIVSNFLSTETDTKYKYNLVQTDAAINPGNSGGGLFEKESGELIGINSLKAVDIDVEGLGFAIDIKEFQKLSSYGSWQKFNPIPRCSDGTPYGSCSSLKELYCSNGNLVSSCNLCGCPSDFPYCSGKGRCFTCASGFSPYQDSNGNGFCCPIGYTAYSDSGGSGFCCAPGTSGTTSGTCQTNS